MASVEQLTRFHTPAYIAALQRAEATQEVNPLDRERHRIGADGNPVYREVFRRPATSAGGVILAARLTADQGGIVHVPGGGTHHGRADRASGFCYLNDAVLGLMAWLDAGLTNVLYVDIDAHHGDGVQDAFHDDARVFTLSVHEGKRWPFTGAADDVAGGQARNFPLAEGASDTDMLAVLEHGILPIVAALRPQAIMLQFGADAIEEDPLSRLGMSNQAHWAVLRALKDAAPRFILLGGGGYNPWSVARCWAGAWGVLNGHAIPERLPDAAEAVLRALTFHRAAGRNPPEHWFTTLADTPRTRPLQDETRALLQNLAPVA
jgi:acetoin utilization protein AcuC